MTTRTASEQLFEDVTTVLNHVLRDANSDYAIHTESNRNARFVFRVLDQKFANPGELGIVVGWVLTAMGWNARTRTLTDEEILIQAAAERVAEALKMFHLLAELVPAFDAQNWDELRRIWEQLRPFHAIIIGSCPIADRLNVILHDPDGQPRDPIH